MKDSFVEDWSERGVELLRSVNVLDPSLHHSRHALPHLWSTHIAVLDCGVSWYQTVTIVFSLNRSLWYVIRCFYFTVNFFICFYSFTEKFKNVKWIFCYIGWNKNINVISWSALVVYSPKILKSLKLLPNVVPTITRWRKKVARAIPAQRATNVDGSNTGGQQWP